MLALSNDFCHTKNWQGKKLHTFYSKSNKLPGVGHFVKLPEDDRLSLVDDIMKSRVSFRHAQVIHWPPLHALHNQMPFQKILSVLFAACQQYDDPIYINTHTRSTVDQQNSKLLFLNPLQPGRLSKCRNVVLFLI